MGQAVFRTVTAALREIEAARSERVSPPVRDARARLVALHGRARLARCLETGRRQSA